MWFRGGLTSAKDIVWPIGTSCVSVSWSGGSTHIR